MIMDFWAFRFYAFFSFLKNVFSFWTNPLEVAKESPIAPKLFYFIKRLNLSPAQRNLTVEKCPSFPSLSPLFSADPTIYSSPPFSLVFISTFDVVFGKQTEEEEEAFSGGVGFFRWAELCRMGWMTHPHRIHSFSLHRRTHFLPNKSHMENRNQSIILLFSLCIDFFLFMFVLRSKACDLIVGQKPPKFSPFLGRFVIFLHPIINALKDLLIFLLCLKPIRWFHVWA